MQPSKEMLRVGLVLGAVLALAAAEPERPSPSGTSTSNGDAGAEPGSELSKAARKAAGGEESADDRRCPEPGCDYVVAPDKNVAQSLRSHRRVHSASSPSPTEKAP